MRYIQSRIHILPFRNIQKQYWKYLKYQSYYWMDSISQRYKPLQYSHNHYQSFTTNQSNNSYNQMNEMEKRITMKKIEKGIIHIELSRPEKLNSLDLEMFESISQMITNIQKDKTIRVVILSGKGKAFCTGLDIKSFFKDYHPLSTMNHLLDRSNNDDVGNLAQNVAYLWRHLDIPVIAVLHGMCFGGGMQIALGADMRYCTPSCQLSLMEAKWGLIPDMSASITLRELVSIDIAKELIMTGKIISGIQAKEIGLVTRINENPMEEALNVARDIVEKSPDSVKACKHMLQDCWLKDDDEVCLKKETQLQRSLLGGYNMIAASSKNLGVNLPYKERK